MLLLIQFVNYAKGVITERLFLVGITVTFHERLSVRLSAKDSTTPRKSRRNAVCTMQSVLHNGLEWSLHANFIIRTSWGELHNANTSHCEIHMANIVDCDSQFLCHCQPSYRVYATHAMHNTLRSLSDSSMFYNRNASQIVIYKFVNHKCRLYEFHLPNHNKQSQQALGTLMVNTHKEHSRWTFTMSTHNKWAQQPGPKNSRKTFANIAQLNSSKLCLPYELPTNMYVVCSDRSNCQVDIVKFIPLDPEQGSCRNVLIPKLLNTIMTSGL